MREFIKFINYSMVGAITIMLFANGLPNYNTFYFKYNVNSLVQLRQGEGQRFNTCKLVPGVGIQGATILERAGTKIPSYLVEIACGPEKTFSLWAAESELESSTGEK